jgi:hypothetical protein
MNPPKSEKSRCYKKSLWRDRAGDPVVLPKRKQTYSMRIVNISRKIGLVRA